MSLKYILISIGAVIILAIILYCVFTLIWHRRMKQIRQRTRAARFSLLSAPRPQIVLLSSTEFEHLHYGSSKKKSMSTNTDITCQKRLSGENNLKCSCNCKNCLVEMESLVLDKTTVMDNCKKRENEYVPNPIISLNNPQ